MRPDTHTTFIRLLVSLASAQASVSDQFLAEQFLKRSSRLIESYLARSRHDHTHAVRSLEEYLDELAHLKSGRPLPIAIARDRLLRYRLAILKNGPDVLAAPVISEAIIEPKKKPKPVAPLSNNAQKILTYVRSSSRARTKDIVAEFNALSERTVKRSLLELTSKGVLRKVSEDRAMYYQAS